MLCESKAGHLLGVDIPVLLNGGVYVYVCVILPPGDTWPCLGTFLIMTGQGVTAT